MMVRRVLAGVTVAVLAAGLLSVAAAPVSATTKSVATEAEYRQALIDLSLDPSEPHVIEVTADITIAGATDPLYDNAGNQPLTINGNGHALDGNNNSRLLFANSTGLLTVNDLTVTRGSAAGGFAVFGRGAVTVTNSTFTDNSAGGGAGGALGGFGAITVTDSVFINNTAGAGGAIFGLVPGATVTVTGSTFTGNSATAGGGGAIFSPGAVSVTNSTLTLNTTTRGGGAIFGGDTVTVTNSTLTNNTATAGSGGAISADETATLVYATVVGNTAPTGANLATEELSRFGSVVADPLGGGANCDIGASPASGGYNYSDDASCAFTGTGDTQNGADPQLLALGDFGGPTQTRPPAVTSPLVDAIPVADCYPGIAIDQRGLPRPADGNLDGTYGCDIGAVELQATPAAAPAAPTATGPVAARPAFTG